MISRTQIRAARALLDWLQVDLARESGLSVETIKRIEKNGLAKSTVENAERIEGVLKGAGIEFIPGGVRLISRDS